MTKPIDFSIYSRKDIDYAVEEATREAIAAGMTEKEVERRVEEAIEKAHEKGPEYRILINRFGEKVLAAVCRSKAGRIIDYYPASWNWVDDLDEFGKDEADAIDKAIFDALNRPFLRLRPWIW